MEDFISKSTNSKRYVSFKSKHAKHFLKTIPFSLARRICMISEKNYLKENKLKELESLLLSQHYPKRIIKTCVSKALRIPQNELRNVKVWKCKKKENLPFYFNLNSHKALHIIKQTVENLKKASNRMRNASKKVKFINLQMTSTKLTKDIM